MIYDGFTTEDDKMYEFFYDDEDIVLTYLRQGTLQDKLDFVGVPASEIRANIDNVVADTLFNMPDDVLHDYAVKYCERLTENNIKGRKYKDEMEGVHYDEDVTDRLSRFIAQEVIKFEKDDVLLENSTFDFEHYSVQLPFEALAEKQKLFIDPKNKFFTGKEYNDLYLNINNSGLQPRMSVQLCTDGDFKKEFFFSPNQMENIHSSFMYTVEAYDKDRDEYHLCGLANNKDSAKQIADFAFKAEQRRTDTNRESRNVPDVDEVNVRETKSHTPVLTITKYRDGFYKRKTYNKTNNERE